MTGKCWKPWSGKTEDHNHLCDKEAPHHGDHRCSCGATKRWFR